MKKLLSIIIGLLIIAPFTFAYYETAERAVILSFNSVTRNVVVERENEMWLLRYKGNCDNMTVGKTVTLAIRSELDGYGDYLKTSSYYKCSISQAERITGTLHVDYVFNNKTQAGVTDENGEKHVILVSSNCSKILGYMYKDIYFRGYKSELSKGDYLFLPRNEGRCPLLYAKHIEKDVSSPEPIDASLDIREPSIVSDVNAVPGDGIVYLNWDEADDNVGIDHYIISHSQYSLETERYDINDLPNKTIVKDSNHTAIKLENENRYYFYVLAVDTSGNTSSRWSEEVSAETKSAIREIDTDPVRPETKIELIQETPIFYLFKWEKIPSYNRKIVTFESDSKRIFSFLNWKSDSIRILKTRSRRGKDLKLSIRQFDIHGGMFKDEFEFRF